MAFPSFIVLSLLVSAVFAQSTPSNPFIPSDISTNCATYLTNLNTNSNFTACTQPILSILQAFSPASNASHPPITTVLQSLCATTTCPQSTVTAELTAFYAACSAEMTSTQNSLVMTTYDSLYSLVPLKQALCSKDDSGNYCAANLSNSSTTTNVTPVNSAQSQAVLSQDLYTTLNSNASAYIANATSYRNANVLFLFLSPSSLSNILCTTCTRNILTAYITFESDCPYGAGLSQSPMLAGQIDLYSNVTNKCGATFLSGAVQAAGGLSSGLVNGATPRIDGQEFSTAIGAILGVAALLAAL